MSAITLTHVGGPTTLLEIGGWRILTDPTFDPPGRTYRFGWGTSSRKTSGPAIEAAEIGPIDVVLLTHEHHADNLDDAGRALLPGATSVLTTVSGAARLGANARGLDAWQTTTLRASGRPTIEVTATPCRHGPIGSHPIVGDVIGFALTWPGQHHGALWITGDSVWYPGIRRVGERIQIGTVIAHLGRVRFPLTGPIGYTMGVDDLVRLGDTMRPHTIVPVHYEGWSHFSQGRTAIERRLRDLGADAPPCVRWAPPGSAIDLDV